MALGINTNVASLNAQNQLNKSQSLSNQALQRLSSGLRINSAKDDAAGLAISTRFDAQIKGLTVAQRNANDGISLAQTTEGALNEITNNMQRIRELAVQAANANNSASDRESLNDEVQQRLAEIDRISSQTAFNGLKVLDGNFGTKAFQIGANAGETISIHLSQGTRTEHVGKIAKQTIGFNPDEAVAEGNTLKFTVGDEEQTITFKGDEKSLEAVVNEINSQLKDASAVVSDDGKGFVIMSTKQIGAVTATGNAFDTDAADADAGLSGDLRTGSVATVDEANEMMVRIDSALGTVNELRGQLGAIQNRFESTIANLATSVENMSASQSRILDADFAAETAKMSKAQVLQQAGISVLAQANARPQQVLSLLQ